MHINEKKKDILLLLSFCAVMPTYQFLCLLPPPLPALHFWISGRLVLSQFLRCPPSVSPYLQISLPHTPVPSCYFAFSLADWTWEFILDKFTHTLLYTDNNMTRNFHVLLIYHHNFQKLFTMSGDFYTFCSPFLLIFFLLLHFKLQGCVLLWDIHSFYGW